MRRYLVIGAGGAGGLIAGFMAKNGADVTVVARGEHLKAIQEDGLCIKTYGEEPYAVKEVKAITAKAIAGNCFDIVFICVKSYSLAEVLPILEKGCHQNTLVISILNNMGAGTFLRSKLPQLNIFDGCVYLTGYVAAPGIIHQPNAIFRIFYGVKDANNLSLRCFDFEDDLRKSGIEIHRTPHIISEIFKKMAFTSPFASCASYYNKKAQDLQHTGTYRSLFIALLRELENIAKVAGFVYDGDLVADNIKILDQLSPAFTASFQKDLLQGKPDERETMIFDMVRLADQYGVAVPNYLRIAQYFGYKQ